MTYAGSEQYQKDVDDAKRNWIVKGDDWWAAHPGRPGPNEVWDRKTVRVVECEADTGSRYVVVVAPLSDVGRRICGGPVMVTVLQPWQDAWALQFESPLHASYVGERLTAGRYSGGKMHGGDLAAITMTVAYALDREAVIG